MGLPRVRFSRRSGFGWFAWLAVEIFLWGGGAGQLRLVGWRLRYVSTRARSCYWLLPRVLQRRIWGCFLAPSIFPARLIELSRSSARSQPDLKRRLVDSGARNRIAMALAPKAVAQHLESMEEGMAEVDQQLSETLVEGGGEDGDSLVVSLGFLVFRYGGR